MDHDAMQERHVGLDAKDSALLQCIAHTFNRCRAVFGVDDQFGDHRVIVLGDFVAAFDAAIHANAGAMWLHEACYRAGRWKEVLIGVFRVEARFDSISAWANLLLLEL